MLIEVFSLSKFFRNNKLIVILCAIIVFISLIGISLRSQSQSHAEQYVGDTVAFGQRAVSYPVQFVSSGLATVDSAKFHPSASFGHPLWRLCPRRKHGHQVFDCPGGRCPEYSERSRKIQRKETLTSVLICYAEV